MTTQEKLEEAIRKQRELIIRFNELTEARQELRDEIMRFDGKIRHLREEIEEQSNGKK